MVKYGQIEQSDVLYAFKRRGFGGEIEYSDTHWPGPCLIFFNQDIPPRKRYAWEDEDNGNGDHRSN